jgi:hypothetical protein
MEELFDSDQDDKLLGVGQDLLKALLGVRKLVLLPMMLQLQIDVGHGDL